MSSIFHYLLFSIVWLVTLLPLNLLYLGSDFLFIVIYYVIPYRKKLTFQNLKNSFPDKNPDEIREIAKKFYKHLTDSFFESLYLIHISKKEIVKRYRYNNLSLLDKIYKSGKSITLLMPHYGNWEWLVNLEIVSPYHLMGVYKPLQNKFIDRLLINLREKFGSETIPMNQTLRRILSKQIKKELTCTLFLYDQRPLGNELHHWVTFMNQDTPVLLGAEKIARKTDQAVVFLKTKKTGRGYYENEFIELYSDPNTVPQYEITNKYYNILEDLLNETPEYWLWSHDRWKYKKPINSSNNSNDLL